MAAIKNISLFVPHVFPNFTKEYVANIFENEIGPVENVDFVLKQDRNGKEFNSAYIHFKYWNNTAENINLQAKLSCQQEARVYHDNPWYWIVLPNNAKKYIPGERKPKIDLGNEKAISVNSLKTPEKLELNRSETIRFCPYAPTKTYSQAVDPLATFTADLSGVKHNIMDDFELDVNNPEYNDAEMDEIEAEMEAVDANLTTIDRRYIQAIENENLWLRNELEQLRAALINLDYLYKVETAKVRALNVTFEKVIPDEK